MNEAVRDLQEMMSGTELATVATGLRVVARVWMENPDSFGDNEADFRNTLREIADKIGWDVR